MINKQVIKQRKEIYGNNFPRIADSWSQYLDKEITPKDVAMMMALMKQVRIDFTNKKIESIKETDYLPAEIDTLNFGLQDSITDKENYLYIATNYKEYEEL